MSSDVQPAFPAAVMTLLEGLAADSKALRQELQNVQEESAGAKAAIEQQSALLRTLSTRIDDLERSVAPKMDGGPEDPRRPTNPNDGDATEAPQPPRQAGIVITEPEEVEFSKPRKSVGPQHPNPQFRFSIASNMSSSALSGGNGVGGGASHRNSMMLGGGVKKRYLRSSMAGSMFSTTSTLSSKQLAKHKATETDNKSAPDGAEAMNYSNPLLADFGDISSTFMTQSQLRRTTEGDSLVQIKPQNSEEEHCLSLEDSAASDELQRMTRPNGKSDNTDQQRRNGAEHKSPATRQEARQSDEEDDQTDELDTSAVKPTPGNVDPKTQPPPPASASTISMDSIIVGFTDLGYAATAFATVVMLIQLYHPSNSFDADAFPPSYFVAWSAIMTVLSAIFIFLRLRIRTRRDTNSWVLEDDPKVIRQVYMRSWFAVDLFLAVPFEFVFLGWLNAGFYYLSSKHFLRYLRMLALVVSPNPLATQRTWYRFIVMCGTMLLITHIAATGFWSATDGLGFTYVDSLYWSVATMTSVGYGDVVPVTEGQKIYTTIAMVVGLVMIALFTAAATSYLTQKDAITEETDKHKMMMTALLTHYKIPWELQKEVIAVFPSVLNSNLMTHFRSSIDALPPFLRDRLTQFFNATQLRTVPMFRSLAEEILLQLASNTHTVFVAAGDPVFSEGDEADSLYVVLRGVVEVVKVFNDVPTVLAALRDGSCFGEMGLLNHQPRSANVVAAVASEVLVLEAEVFNELLETSDEFRSAIEQFAAERQVALAPQKKKRTNGLGQSTFSTVKSISGSEGSPTS